ncbi:MAG: alcohol dehydrogenase [Betaproteobacteria bacterium TMED100]|nr:MAG: alcohol dehydrogenase [Betaproteobacteria bacterium TMED100]
MYKAILLKDKENDAEITSINLNDLPSGDVTVQIEFSTINYKDSLAIVNKIPIIRKFPMVPGIDFVGKVLESNSSKFSENQKVILNGWGVGESHWGGLSQIARVNSDWLIPLPKDMSSKMAMEIGTAGFTAMLCLMSIESHGIKPSDGKILVTGATGGVGSLSIALLSANGYEIIASSGKENQNKYLRSLGASEILNRTELNTQHKALDQQKWVAAIDTLGSKTLANICATTKSGGAIAACGMAQGMDLSTTVAPFILRGITLYGINSVNVPKDKRIIAWNRLSADLANNKLELMSNCYKLDEVTNIAQKILRGEITGRCVIDVNS